MRQLVFELRLAPVAQLYPHLEKSPLAARLDAPGQEYLLAQFHEPLWSQAVAFGVNAFLFPGVGSLIQGDTTWGLAMSGGTLLGYGLLFSAIMDFRWSSPQIGIGMGLVAVSWIVGLVRPWLYEDVRYTILKNHFSRMLRIGSTTLRLEPYLIAELTAPPPAWSSSATRRGNGEVLGLGLKTTF
jgi:hypothetical protein